MNKMLLMVYGTLMNNFHNNGLLKEQKYLGKCETKEKYTMYVNGIPYVFPDKETSTIKGELWEVSGEDYIQDLDSLEGHPDWYERKEIEVDFNGKSITVWLYFMPDSSVTLSTMTIIKNGDFANPEYVKNNNLIETINN